MLSHLHDNDMPQADEAASILDSYAVLIEDALAELPRHIGSMVYLPTLRVQRACADAASRLHIACDGLDSCDRFHSRLQGESQRHPIDLVGLALDEVSSVRAKMIEHQGDNQAPVSNRVMLQILAEAVRLADEDLRGMLGPVVKQLSARECQAR